MNTIVVRMSDLTVSGRECDVLVTYSLGSCIAVAAYNPSARIGGLIHCMLPDSTIHPAKAAERPCMFVNTGIPHLLHRLSAAGCPRDNLVIKIAGAACMLPDESAFMIGSRNQAACRNAFANESLTIAASSVGGNTSRSMSLNVGSGRVLIRQYGRETEL